ncbi:helix-turn-helix domain-containing protein [Rhodococcus sp. LB1]|uniref:helix-turn-helix domain-containing protein n=1 Tax=Rhodococcus sp. LB1 TaxID=1807499 RepID=UPI00077A02B9|nr:helix-turn-helix domain-containing protein [Rhodococcus sp. LB1]KXX59705.1 hypothetical protein AZG88_06710 [Rhodococcus sp. LB1]
MSPNTDRRIDDRPLVSIAEAADFLDMSEVSVRRMIADKILPAARVGNTTRIRIRRADLEKILNPVVLHDHRRDPRR